MLTSPIGALVCDTVRTAKWQSESAYDYNHELMAPEISIFEWFHRQFGELLWKIFGSRPAEEHSELMLICLAAIVLPLIMWFVYKKRSELLMRSSRNKPPYEIGEDMIYGVDFSGGIADVLFHSNYRGVVCLFYLQTLKRLNDGKRTDWQPYKTPTQYISEVWIPVFRQLTNRSLRARYGNFETIEEPFNSMKSLQEEIGKGGGS